MCLCFVVLLAGWVGGHIWSRNLPGHNRKIETCWEKGHVRKYKVGVKLFFWQCRWKGCGEKIGEGEFIGMNVGDIKGKQVHSLCVDSRRGDRSLFAKGHFLLRVP